MKFTGILPKSGWEWRILLVGVVAENECCPVTTGIPALEARKQKQAVKTAPVKSLLFMSFSLQLKQ
jgi:hypothetical protein